MARGKGRKGPKTIFDKVNDIDPSFASEVYSLTDSALNDKLALMAKHRADIEDARKNDKDINDAKASLKVMNETYSEPLKAISLKTKLVCDILKGRGQA